MTTEQHYLITYLRADRPLATGRQFGPREARALPGRCAACDHGFLPGDYTTLIALGPGGDLDQQQRCRDKRPYNAVAIEVHWRCATGESPVRPAPVPDPGPERAAPPRAVDALIEAAEQARNVLVIHAGALLMAFFRDSEDVTARTAARKLGEMGLDAADALDTSVRRMHGLPPRSPEERLRIPWPVPNEESGC